MRRTLRLGAWASPDEPGGVRVTRESAEVKARLVTPAGLLARVRGSGPSRSRTAETVGTRWRFGPGLTWLSSSAQLDS